MRRFSYSLSLSLSLQESHLSVCQIHLRHVRAALVVLTEPVEQHAIAAGADGAAAGGGQAPVAGLEQALVGLDVGAREGLGGSVADVVVGVREAVGGVEEVVGAVFEDDVGGFDEGPVVVVAVEDRHGPVDRRDPVFGYPLQHDRRRLLRLDPVVAVAAVADAVPVDLVHDVSAAVYVPKPCGVDRPALVQGAGEGRL